MPGGDAVPQSAWSKKRECQYEHIRESELEAGRPEDRAEEIAAKTVNKQRAEDGETRGSRQPPARSSAKRAQKE